MPTQEFSHMTVHDDGQHSPTIPAGPDSTEVRSQTLIWGYGHRWQCLDSGSEAHWPLLALPAFELEDALDSILVSSSPNRDYNFFLARNSGMASP